MGNQSSIQWQIQDLLAGGEAANPVGGLEIYYMATFLNQTA